MDRRTKFALVKQGYDMNGGNCDLRICKCDLGIPAKGERCPKAGAQKCEACPLQGWKMGAGKKQCEPVCTCDPLLGTPEKPPVCKAPGNNCKACTVDGFGLEKIPAPLTGVVIKDPSYKIGICKPFRCTCSSPGGHPLMGPGCPKNGVAKCASADPGFHLSEDRSKTIKNPCTCANGEPATGASCASPGHICEPKIAATLSGSLGGHGPAKKCNKGAHPWGVGLAARCFKNVCICEYGKVDASKTCPEHGAELCSKDCSPGFHLKGEKCVANVCKCPRDSGVPAKGPSCPKHGSVFCDVCVPGWVGPGKDGICKARCYCDAGLAFEDLYPKSGWKDSCPKMGAKRCKKCFVGYKRVTTGKEITCKPICTCRNGTPVEGGACVYPREQCNDCKKGYELSKRGGNLCVPKCTCQGGTPARGVACGPKPRKFCGVCDEGHTGPTQDGECIKICFCKHGLAVAPKKCPVNGQEACEKDKCFEGFSFDPGKQTCEVNKCKCSAKGEKFAVVGAACPKVGEERCQRCARGFVFSNGQCAENKCKCENGTPASGELCLYDGMDVCEKCDTDAGYELKENTQLCDLRVCRCPGGQPVVGATCPTSGATKCVDGSDDPAKQSGCTCPHGKPSKSKLVVLADPKKKQCKNPESIFCTSCNPGYTMFGEECVKNKCTCLLGDAAEGTDCDVPGTEKCTKCRTPGYKLVGSSCKPQCRCKNGTPVGGNDCLVPIERCQKCDGSYKLTGFDLCEPTCSCKNGFPVSGLDCPAPPKGKNTAEKCAACNPGFVLSQVMMRREFYFPCCFPYVPIHNCGSHTSFSYSIKIRRRHGTMRRLYC